MSTPISRSRVHAGCTGGDTGSHLGKFGVRAAAMAKKAKKALREKEKKGKQKGESERKEKEKRKFI